MHREAYRKDLMRCAFVLAGREPRRRARAVCLASPGDAFLAKMILGHRLIWKKSTNWG
jgi:hypothetical protein